MILGRIGLWCLLLGCSFMMSLWYNKKFCWILICCKITLPQFFDFLKIDALLTFASHCSDNNMFKNLFAIMSVLNWIVYFLQIKMDFQDEVEFFVCREMVFLCMNDNADESEKKFIQYSKNFKATRPLVKKFLQSMSCGFWIRKSILLLDQFLPVDIRQIVLSYLPHCQDFHTSFQQCKDSLPLLQHSFPTLQLLEDSSPNNSFQFNSFKPFGRFFFLSCEINDPM